MENLIQWFVEYSPAIFGALFGVHALAIVVVNATPTPRDNEWLGKFYKAVEWAAGIFGYTAKEYPGDRAIEREFAEMIDASDVEDNTSDV